MSKTKIKSKLAIRNLPNLDAMPLSDVSKFAKRASAAAARATGKRRNVLTYAAMYATHKANAMRHRLKGKINDAIRNEDICDFYYKNLPADVRW